MSDGTSAPDSGYVPPTIEVSTSHAAVLAGPLEYLEAIVRVAMYEQRARPRQLDDLRLARDVLVQWSRENVVEPRSCTCPRGAAMMAGCPVHDIDAGALP